MPTCAWVVPVLIEGSGGHRTILQHADALQKCGWDVFVYIEDHPSKEPNQVRQTIFNYFGYDFKNVHVGWDIQRVDAVFATIWYSARIVRDLRFQCTKFYFVQDYEPGFNPVGDAYLLAENSYRFGLIPITIGRWLTHKLATDFLIPSTFFDFCADRSLYEEVPNVQREPAVAFIYQPDKPRRCPVLGIEALGILKHRRPDIKIYLFGSSLRGNIWFECDHLGLISPVQCSALYNKVSVGLCLSSSNPSRIPFEMMACALPVVELYRDNNFYDMPDSAVLLCDQNPESLAEGIINLMNSPDRRKAMSLAGAQYMEKRGLEQGIGQFLRAVADGLNGQMPSALVPSIVYNLPPVVAPLFSSSIGNRRPEINFFQKAPGFSRKFATKLVRWGISKIG